MNKLVSDLLIKIKDMGVKRGDILYVASDITKLIFKLADEYEIDSKEAQNQALNDLVTGLQEIVTSEGTLLFPAFSWDFCRGKGFDVKKTRSEVGALSNWILKNRRDFERTGHALYSFLVWGKDAEYLAGLHNQDAWGAYSPFVYLMDKEGKQLDFDIEAYQGLTFVHFTEQCANVPYRHPKYFFGEYTDSLGRSEMRMYSMNVRDIDVQTGVSARDEFLISKGCAIKEYVEEISLTLIDLKASYPVIYDDIVNNGAQNTLYFNNYDFDINAPKTLEYEISRIPE